MRGSSTTHGGSTCFPMNPKAAEAELISKATQTAIVAARSILMSGGTEESALKTAKAAAESVLNPAASDSDTVSGMSNLGSAFGGKKRKAKRQAEVVASMALMSATSLHPNGNGASECDSMNKMYGRNIITVRQDEPSVLSGSTKPPKPPTTPRSHTSLTGFMDHSFPDETREPAQETPSLSDQLPPISPSSIFSSTISNILPQSVKDDEEDSDRNMLNIKTLSQSTTMDSEHRSSIESSTIAGRSDSDDDSDEDTSAFFFNKKTEKEAEAKSKPKRSSSWNITDALISPFAATLNILHCGQTVNGDAVQDVEQFEYDDNDKNKRRRDRKGRRARRHETSIFDSRDDTFDDETTVFSHHNTKRKGGYRDTDFATSYSYTSSNSENTDLSEGDLKVRTSIRETMETLVNKSKISYRKSKANEPKKRWKSFETKQMAQKRPSVNAQTSQRRPSGGGSLKLKKRPSGTSRRSSNNTISSKDSKRPPTTMRSPSMRKRATSFFKRDKGRR